MAPNTFPRTNIRNKSLDQARYQANCVHVAQCQKPEVVKKRTLFALPTTVVKSSFFSPCPCRPPADHTAKKATITIGRTIA